MNKVTVMITLDAKSQEEKKSVFLAVRHERKTGQYSLGINTKLTKHEFNNPRLNAQTKMQVNVHSHHLSTFLSRRMDAESLGWRFRHS